MSQRVDKHTCDPSTPSVRVILLSLLLLLGSSPGHHLQCGSVRDFPGVPDTFPDLSA